MNNHPIGSALELGIMACLVSLQKTSPGLLLTSIQLKETIRNTRYVPALSAALALVVCKTQDSELKASMLQNIQRWSSGTNSQSQQQGEPASRAGSPVHNLSVNSNPPILVDSSMDTSADDSDDSARISTLGPLLESRLRFVCAQKKETRRTRQSRYGESREGGSQGSDDAVGLDEFLRSEQDSASETQMQDGTSSTRESFSEEGLSVSSTSEHSVVRDLPTSGRRLNPDEDDFDDDEWW
jgi:hypothetical protein